MDRLIPLVLAAAVLADPELPARWFEASILPRERSAGAMDRWADAALRPAEPPADLEAWRERAAAIREALIGRLGLGGVWPPEGPPEVESKGSVRRDGYRVERLAFEGWPGVRVPALLYLPDRIPNGGAPGIVAVGDGANGKADRDAQARDGAFARLGLVVLRFDRAGSGERAGFRPEELEAPASFVARTRAGLEAVEVLRALDVLAARPEVDPARIGILGSGGLDPAVWVAALDQRPAAVALGDLPAGPADLLEHAPPGLLAAADLGEVLALRAPRPTRVGGGARPAFEPPGRLAREVFALHGREAAAALVLADDRADAADDWLARTLLGREPGPQVDRGFEPLTAAELAVGASGAIRSAADLGRAWLAEPEPPPTPKAREDVEAFADAARPRLAALLGFPTQPGLAEVELIGKEDDGDRHAAFFAVRVEPGLDIPVAEFRPAGEGPWHVEAMVGRRSSLKGAVDSALKAGRMALVIEPRGAGELDWGGARSDRVARVLGRPRAGQEAYDILRATALWLARPDVATVSLAADGRFGTPALLAAALDPRLAGLAARLPETERARAGTGASADVPGLLGVGDLPQLAAMIAPRPLALRVPDPSAYGWAEAAYRAFEVRAAILPTRPPAGP